MAMLEECRRAFGGPARRFSLWQWHTYLKARKPRWLHVHFNDLTNGIYRDQRALLTTGRVVWGHIIQANQLLFSPGPDDMPAEVIYSFDPALESDATLRTYEDLAARLFALKGTAQSDPRLAEISRVLAAEIERTPRRELPRDLTAGRQIFHTTIMGVRKHLPRGHLAEPFFPLVASPDLTWTMILPARFWPAELHTSWQPTRPRGTGAWRA
jgi:hypothetical protein